MAEPQAADDIPHDVPGERRESFGIHSPNQRPKGFIAEPVHGRPGSDASRIDLSTAL